MPADQLAVEIHPFRIELVAAAEEAPQAFLAAVDDALQLVLAERVVTDEDDPADLGLGPFDDLEDHVHPVLRQLDDERIDGRREPPLAGIDAQQLRAVLLRHACGEHRARAQLQRLLEVVFLDVVIALEADLVDQRVLVHVDDQRIAVALQAHVAEQAGRIQRAQAAIHALAAERIARLHQHVGKDRAFLDPRVARDAYARDRVALLGGT